MKRQNLLLLVAVILLTVLPLVLIKPATSEEALFTGSDGQAEAAITQIRPDYQPWFAPLWEPPSGEIESLLFGLQAALGAGVIGYCLGLYRGRKLGRDTHAPSR
jgi:cobalt/nickel transport protein